MTKKEIKQLVHLCNYPELQKLWQDTTPKMGQEVFMNGIGTVQRPLPKPGFYKSIAVYFSGTGSEWYLQSELIWLPRIEDCIRLMGRKFERLTWFSPDFECGYYDGTVFIYEEGKSPRLACLKSLQSVLEGK